MPYLFKDLIVTVVPRGIGSGSVASGSGGCGGCSDAGSATVGSCTSECNDRVGCLDSGEVIDATPYSFIDPPYQLELRQMLIHALNASNVVIPEPTRMEVLEDQMRPQSAEEVKTLERQLTGALEQLRAYGAKLEQQG